MGKLITIIIILIASFFTYKIFLEENCYRVEKNYLIVKKYERVCQKGIFGPKYVKKVNWEPFWAGN